MREKERIDKYCQQLADVWKQIPDMRFGQLMINLEKAFRTEYGGDWFYREDPEIFAFIERKIGEWLK